jgi:signal transduction histidine kinase/PAS domain-containing protein
MSTALALFILLLVVTFFVLGMLVAGALRRRQVWAIDSVARQVAIERMHDGLIVVDAGGLIVEHNDAAVALAGLAHPARGQLLSAAAHNRQLATALSEMLLTATSTTLVVCQAQAAMQPAHQAPTSASARADARSQHIRVTRTPLSDPSGRQLGTLFLLRDITSQALAEQALARQAANMAALHQVASSVGATLDPHTLLATIVTSARDSLGIAHATVGLIDQDRGDLTITAESDSAGGASAIGATLTLHSSPFKEQGRTGKPIVIEDAQGDTRLSALHDLLARCGTRSLLVVPLRANDRLIGTLNLASATARRFDDTELALAQMIAGYVAAALANARLFAASRQASRAKSAILDTVSHEFRTPITAILGFTELYQESVLGPVTEEQREALGAIHRNAHRLLKLVDDLLDLARLEAGKLEMALSPVDVGLCVHEAASALRAQFQKKRLPLHLDIAADLPFAWADAMWLRRVLLNLLTNALRFTTTGAITVRAYEIDQAAGQGRLVIEVEDTGTGIPELDQQTIFEPFRRADDTRSAFPGGAGSGLGLAISKRAIDQMDGQLAIRSRPGAGSVFTISLHPTELALEHA